MISLILWEVNWTVMTSEFQGDPEGAAKVRISTLERIKEEVDSGVIKMWGVSPAGGRGFMVFEGDEKALFAQIQKSAPRFKCKVEPMISIDEALAHVKEMQK
jgi:hypothetical protein